MVGVGTASAAPLHVLKGQHYAQPPTTAQCEEPPPAGPGIACYSPLQIEQAYNMHPLYNAGLAGQGKTIVLVDSFGSPTIQSDLAQFDKDFNLPAPPSFKVIQPDGPVPAYNPNGPDMISWAIESSLDVEYSHAMAPDANILLVETPVDETEGVTGLPQMMQAENYVIDHHLGDVISQSFGATEATFANPGQIYALRGAFFNALVHRVTVLAAAGDGGATDETSAPDESDFYPFRVNSWPSSDPLVTSVGGLQLHLAANGDRIAPDNVWNDGPSGVCGPVPCAGGGGVSAVFGRPSYQWGVPGVKGITRNTPDVSMSAAVNGGVLVYIGVPGLASGYYIIGGTSEASPLFSGIVAIADQAGHRDLGLLNPRLYQLGDGPGSGIDDITLGNNTSVFTNPATDPYPGPHVVTGYDAVPGYDPASGLGTADGPKLVAQLAAHAQGWHRR